MTSRSRSNGFLQEGHLTMEAPQAEKAPPKSIDGWDNTKWSKNFQIGIQCHTNGWWVREVRLDGGKGETDYLIVACQEPSSPLP